MNKPICYSHVGKRSKHEDNFFLDGLYLTYEIQKQMSDKHCYFASHSSISNRHLYAVSDGMGGHKAGEIASRICVEILSLAYKEIQHAQSFKEALTYLHSAITKINDTICNMSRKKPELKGMGATLVLLLIYDDEYVFLNIGDSRAYHFSKTTVVQITKDHTEGQRMIDFGLLTPKELFTFPFRKNLSRYLGYDQNGFVLQADEYYPDLENGIVLLCSDGISDFLSNAKIFEILSTAINLEMAGRRLVNEAVSAHNADNVTVILIPIRR